MPQLSYAGKIRNAVLIVHGEKAHSRYFGEDAFKMLKGDSKELMIIPGASHVDLYDRVDIIPFVIRINLLPRPKPLKPNNRTITLMVTKQETKA